MPEKKILVIDDDPLFLKLVEQILTARKYEVLKAGTGQEGLRFLFTGRPDLVLLDVVMPGLDGWQTCQRIREISDVPVILLTGKKRDEEDIVRGLDFGADDYLMKPVGNRELVARVQAVLRRADATTVTGAGRKTIYQDDFLTVNLAERKVLANGQRVRLTPIEFRLFALLLENSGRILTHKQVLEKVWGWEYIDDLDYVRIYISHLRQKIEPVPAKPRYVLTEPGVGYFFQKSN